MLVFTAGCDRDSAGLTGIEWIGLDWLMAHLVHVLEESGVFVEDFLFGVGDEGVCWAEEWVGFGFGSGDGRGGGEVLVFHCGWLQFFGSVCISNGLWCGIESLLFTVWSNFDTSVVPK